MASIAKALPSLEEFERDVEEYAASLTVEDKMESGKQHRQIGITDESLILVTKRWPECQCFGDLLIQYMHNDKIARVCPDNMIVLSKVHIEDPSSFKLPLLEARIVLVAEYVSDGDRNQQKDYEDSYNKYEQQLQVPYYLTFDPFVQDLRLHVLEDGTYVRADANAAGRFEIEQLDLEVCILEGWLRWWYQGLLMAIPTELEERANQERQRADQERQRADQLQAQLDQLRASQGKNGSAGQ